MTSFVSTLHQKLTIFEQVLRDFPELRYIGDPDLRTKTSPVTLNEGRLISQQLGEVLIRYRALAGCGRGLAAPQLGWSKAVFVTYVDNQLQTFLNPKIVERSTEMYLYRELCLSTGMLVAYVKRPQWVVLDWTDLQGEHHQQKFEGMLARLYQHEEAHLRGIVNIDEAEPGSIEFEHDDPLKEQLRVC